MDKNFCMSSNLAFQLQSPITNDQLKTIMTTFRNINVYTMSKSYKHE